MDQELSSIAVKFPVTTEAIELAAQKIKREMGDKIVNLTVVRGSERTMRIELSKDNLLEVGRYLHDDLDLLFEYSAEMTGVDMITHFESHIFLHSIERGLSCQLKVTDIDAEDPHCPSSVSIWVTNDWHEREAYDMFGIYYDGHPDLRRIYMSEDFAGFPLRKSFAAPGRNVGGHNGGAQILRTPQHKEGTQRG